MKVFLGNNNIANILAGLMKGLEYNGIEVISLEKEKSNFYESTQFNKIYRYWDNITFKSQFLHLVKEKIDYSLQNYRCKRYLKKHIKDIDVFIFLWSSILSDFSDYKYIKKYNKKIITAFAGSDVRFSKAFSEQYNVNIDKWEEGLKNDDINEKLKSIRYAELYSDLILSVPDQSGLMIKDYNHFFLPLDISYYPFSIHQTDIPTILHAPTRSGAKGTDFFLEIVDKLQKEGLRFKFTLIQNLKHHDLIQLLSKSDILLDELYTYGPGMMGTEAMATGCVVVTKKDCTITDIFDPPVCDVTFETAYDKIKQLITDKRQRYEIAQKARKFIEEKNDCTNVIKEILKSVYSSERDYSPVFYSQNLHKPWINDISEANNELTKDILKDQHVSEINKHSLQSYMSKR
jgi:glycosyltransferase involved in cell wall biosynthesis